MVRWIMAAMLLLATTGIAAAQAPAAAMARGKVLYQHICMSCHQADGSGVPRMNPPLIKTSFVLGDKTRLITIILKGLNEDVEIEGEYYSNPMPPQAQLRDDEIADVLTFVRNSFGNKAGAVKPADVKVVRAKLKL
jgi:mono/diheme cytochrome c family protein